MTTKTEQKRNSVAEHYSFGTVGSWVAIHKQQDNHKM